MLLLLAQAAAVDVPLGVMAWLQRWIRELRELVDKVLAVRESVDFNKRLSVEESDEEVLNWLTRCWPWEKRWALTRGKPWKNWMKRC
jgi:hypothetical protein